jgi:hypothetical protein
MPMGKLTEFFTIQKKGASSETSKESEQLPILSGGKKD